MNRAELFTVGHSDLPIDDFLALLRTHGIRAVADVRRFPGSRRHPQFGRDALRDGLAGEGIGYEWVEALGGRRRTRPGVPSPNGALTSASFRAYADYMQTEEFRAAAARLLDRARERPTTVMCAEKLFWRCHRRLISDYLTAQGAAVVHLLGEGKTVAHTLSPEAVVTPDRRVEYPPPQ